MSARLVWLAQCEVCTTTTEFDGALSIEQLGAMLKDAGWELPVYGGTFCARCAKAIKEMGKR